MHTDEMYHAAYNILSVRAEQLDEDELYHHGIRGQKWGVRRYQNEDGTLTPVGEKHYLKEQRKAERQARKDEKRIARLNRRYRKIDKKYEKEKKKYDFEDSEHNIRYEYRKEYEKKLVERRKKAIKAIAIIGVSAAAYKFGPTVLEKAKPVLNQKVSEAKKKVSDHVKQQINEAVNEAVSNAQKSATTAAKNVVKQAPNVAKDVGKKAAGVAKDVGREGGNALKELGGDIGYVGKYYGKQAVKGISNMIKKR